MVDTNTKQCDKCHEIKPYSRLTIKSQNQNEGAYLICKTCENKRNALYKKTKNGLIAKIYGSQRFSSRKRSHVMPAYTLTELRNWASSQPIFHELYAALVESDYSKLLVPSCDRLDDYAPYTLDNLQIMTWRENYNKGVLDKKNGTNNKQLKSVVQMTNDGLFVAEYHSMNYAERLTGINNRHISACCLRKRKTAGGFRWMKSLGIPIHNNMVGV